MKLPATPPDQGKLMSELGSKRLIELISSSPTVPTSKYLHWDELRRRPTPFGLSHEEWWLKLKFGRRQLARELPLKDCKEKSFSYCLIDYILEALSAIDSQGKVSMGVSDQIVNTGEKDRYIISSLIEESITSSQLEGAATTRKVAAEMLRSGRAPKDKSELMILNNFKAMQYISFHKDEEITRESLCELHEIVTAGTLDNPRAAGQIQRPADERVAIWDDTDSQILHTPPPALELESRIDAMCKFANAVENNKSFIHPIIRAIVLHFWLAYDHPFEDGNGRTARALFYWAMLKQGYWLFEFISISSFLKKAPASYARSFLYTETDENDLTYFIIYQLGIISRAIDALEKYIQKKSGEARLVDNYLKNSLILNHRQKALIGHALKKPYGVYTIESHKRSHNIAYGTSRSDLLQLVELGLLNQFKVGKALHFKASKEIESRLRELD